MKNMIDRNLVYRTDRIVPMHDFWDQMLGTQVWQKWILWEKNFVVWFTNSTVNINQKFIIS